MKKIILLDFNDEKAHSAGCKNLNLDYQTSTIRLVRLCYANELPIEYSIAEYRGDINSFINAVQC